MNRIPFLFHPHSASRELSAGRTDHILLSFSSGKLVTACLFCALQVTMSDWEASQLNPAQVRYAALDSLIAADIFRALRFYHHLKPECRSCSTLLGEWPGNLDLCCAAPECALKKPFKSISALMAHANSTGHEIHVSRQAS